MSLLTSEWSPPQWLAFADMENPKRADRIRAIYEILFIILFLIILVNLGKALLEGLFGEPRMRYICYNFNCE